jgi:outer membrane protein OmpA-like peptidoglycan-associated protein
MRRKIHGLTERAVFVLMIVTGWQFLGPLPESQYFKPLMIVATGIYSVAIALLQWTNNRNYFQMARVVRRLNDALHLYDLSTSPERQDEKIYPPEWPVFRHASRARALLLHLTILLLMTLICWTAIVLSPSKQGDMMDLRGRFDRLETRVDGIYDRLLAPPQPVPRVPPHASQGALEDVERALNELQRVVQASGTKHTPEFDVLSAQALRLLADIISPHLANAAAAPTLAKTLLQKFLESVAQEGGKQGLNALLQWLKSLPHKPVKEIRTYLVHFDFDSAEVPESGRSVLREAAAAAKKDPGVLLWVVGYCDRVGSEQYNRHLSLKRSEAAAELLRLHGIEPRRILVEGQGEEVIPVPTADESKEPDNRVVEITLL